MFPLSTAYEAQLRQEAINEYQSAKAAYVPSSAFSLKDRAVMHGVTQAMGSSNPISAMRHTANAVTQTQAMAAKLNAKEMATIVITRWAFIPAKETHTVLVDILEYRFMSKLRPFYIKHSSTEPVKLALLGKTGVKIKPEKQYSKAMNFKDIEEVGMHFESGEVSPMVMVKREQRGITPAEWREMQKRYEHGWNVPKI